MRMHEVHHQPSGRGVRRRRRLRERAGGYPPLERSCRRQHGCGRRATTVTGSGELDAVLPADGDAAATVDAALATALDVDTTGTAPADASEGGPWEPTPVEVPEPASAAPSPGSSAMEPVSGTDTTAEVPDTTPDTASSSPVSASAPVAVQTVPTNVNVSVRIASAGDNGPVTQTNVAASVSTGASPGSTAPASATTSTSGAPQSRATPTAPALTSAPAAAAEDDIGTWSWQWDCVPFRRYQWYRRVDPAADLRRRTGHGSGTAEIIQDSIKGQLPCSIIRVTSTCRFGLRAPATTARSPRRTSHSR